MIWSHSLHQTLRRCQRQFAFTYLLASATADSADRREAFLLKQVQSLVLWRGHLVHQTIALEFAEALRRGRLPSADELASAAWARAVRQMEFSRSGKYRELVKSEDPDYVILRPHVGKREIEREELVELRRDFMTCFRNLLVCDPLESLRGASKHETELQLMVRVGEDRFRAHIDWLALRPSEPPVVVDWKVGSAETADASLQLGLYALALVLAGRWPRARVSEVQLWEVNLLLGRSRQVQVSDLRLLELEDLVYTSAHDATIMAGATTDGAIALSEFAIAASPGTCAMCSYVPLCARLLAQEGRARESLAVQGMLAWSGT